MPPACRRWGHLINRQLTMRALDSAKIGFNPILKMIDRPTARLMLAMVIFLGALVEFVALLGVDFWSDRRRYRLAAGRGRDWAL
jgi:hypothetical protein